MRFPFNWISCDFKMFIFEMCFFEMSFHTSNLSVCNVIMISHWVWACVIDKIHRRLPYFEIIKGKKKDLSKNMSAEKSYSNKYNIFFRNPFFDRRNVCANISNICCYTHYEYEYKNTGLNKVLSTLFFVFHIFSPALIFSLFIVQPSRCGCVEFNSALWERELFMLFYHCFWTSNIRLC